MADKPSSSLPDFQAWELRLYRILGVPQFRKLIFRYARIRHRRRGGRNPNYHLKGLSMTDVEAFLPQMRRNVRYHVTSLVLLAVCWLLIALRGDPIPGVIPLTLVLIWLNTWCLLLQRYHYLRICMLHRKNNSRKMPESTEKSGPDTDKQEKGPSPGHP